MDWTLDDSEKFEELRLSVAQVEAQLERFRTGFPEVVLDRPAIAQDGIHIFTPEEEDRLAQYFDEHKQGVDMLKFVPASGAATRMFKHLFAYQPGITDLLCDEFVQKLTGFPFFSLLDEEVSASDEELHRMLATSDYNRIFHFVLHADGLGYGSLPKALIHFHRYTTRIRTSLEEHLVEAAEYARQSDQVCKLHFTVSPEHQRSARYYVEQVKPAYEAEHSVRYSVDFSVQRTSTNTLAVDIDNNPFREHTDLLFRPGGHGALIENINALKSDLVFIKNIDNVVHESWLESTSRSKKILAGKLLETKTAIHDALRELDAGVTPERFEELRATAAREWNIHVSEDDSAVDLHNRLNRPIRVCGMVENQGAPGGGPFWVRKHGELSLQIVEKAQVNLADEAQRSVLESSTHFNPVDLVCWLKDYRREAFDLLKFRDDETGLVSEKSYKGKPLKAQELPGLWNGAMAHWITVFVEVPLETFNPVKTVNDLLQKYHQPQ